ncbi:MAG: secretin N-terminal domain-containing protein [Nitrospiria bacterium]
MRDCIRAGLISALFLVGMMFPCLLRAEPQPVAQDLQEEKITLDFNNVNLPVLVQFISELTGKNFVIDERVRGKVTIFSPGKIAVSQVYDVFVSVLELKGLAVVVHGDIYQIRPMAEVPPSRSVHVYTLENTSAEEMAKVLRGLVSKPAGRRGRVSQTSRPPERGIGELTGPTQVLADKATNSLIITATLKDYEIIKEVIRKLDKKRSQVFVEAVVLEMRADKFRELGTDIGAVFGYTNKSRDVAAIGGFNQDPSDLLTLARVPGVVELGKVNIRGLLKALQSADDVNILSTPQILTSDGQKAEIVVAENIPFPGAQSQTTGGNVQTTIERKDVGVILRLTPKVLENDLVRLDVYQEISSVTETSQSVGNTVLGPTTNKRSANTTVVVHDGQSVVIGGLIRDNAVVTERKVPLLGDIPLLGWLFKVQSKRLEKTNLMIFLTPHIVEGQRDLDEIRLEKTTKAAVFLEDHRLPRRESREAVFEKMVNLPQ